MTWRDSAACLGSPELFFAAAGDDEKRGTNTDDHARAICGRCEVQSECLDYAIGTNQKEGIWGGLNYKERRSEQNRQRYKKRAEYFRRYYVNKRKAS